MRTVFFGDSLHEMSNPVLWTNSEKKSICRLLIFFSLAVLESLFCGHAGCGHAGHRLPAIVYVKPKICDQCYFSYYPPTLLPPTPIKKGKKEQCTIINTMCIVVKNLYALYVQLSEPLNSLYTLIKACA